jgi:hypothetical protein
VFFVYQGMNHLYKLRFFAKNNNPYIEELFTLYPGTTRITEYSYKCFSCILGFFNENLRMVQAHR